MNDADLYQKSNCVHKRDVPKFLEEYSSKFKSHKKYHRVLDMGCGDGSVTNILKKHILQTHPNFKLVGCDISKNMVDYANDHNSDEQTSFIVLNIEGDIPEEMRGKFDHIFSFYAMNWVLNQERAFENIYNLLDEEGECFLIIISNIVFFEVYRRLVRKEKWSVLLKDLELYVSPYHDSQDPENKIRNTAKEAGFDDINVELADMSYRFEDLNIFKSLIRAINPFKIPEEKYEDFMEDYLELLKEFKVIDESNEGIAILKYRLLVFHARKTSNHISME